MFLKKFHRSRGARTAVAPAFGTVAFFLAAAGGARVAFATNYYFDTNGTTVGSGVTAAGSYSWEAANWDTAADGTGASATYVDGNTPTFAAGTDATVSYTVTANANHTIAGMALEDGSLGSTLTLNGTGNLSVVSGTQTFAVAMGSTLKIMNKLTGARGLVNYATTSGTGGASLDLYGANDYSGGTIISTNSGFNINSGSSLGTGPVSMGDGTNGTTAATSVLINTSDAIGAIALAGYNFNARATVPSGLSLFNGPNVPMTLSGQFTLGTNMLYTISVGSGASSVATLSGQIVGTNSSLVKNGPGTLNLTGASSTYSGATTVSVGTLSATHAASLGGSTGPLIVSNGLTSGTGTAVVLNLSTTEPTTKGSLSGTLGSPTFGTDTATINNGGQLFTINQTIANTFQGTIAGAGGFALGSSSTAALTLNNVGNSWSGGTSVLAGTLKLGNDNVIPSGVGKGNVSVAANGTIDLSGHNLTVNGLSGAGTVDNSSASAFIILTVGANDATSTFTGKLQNSSGAIALTKTGTGTFDISGATVTYSGSTTVTGGKLIMSRIQGYSQGGFGTINNVTISGGGTLQVHNSTPTPLPTLPSGNNADISRPGNMISIANNGAALGSRVYTGTLDLGDNDLIIDYFGATPLADVRDMIRSGYNGGNWKGTGITSSTAANPLAFGNFALGYADNSSLVNKFGDGTGDGSPAAGNAGHGPLFFGQSVDLTTVLVKFTHRVDLNLDGFITSNDASIFNGSYNEGQPATWSTGDLNYNGIFDTNDASIFNGAYNEALASLPEPGSLALSALIGLGLRRRAHR